MIVLFGSTFDALAQQDSFCLTQPVPYYLPTSFSMGDDCFEGPYTLRVYLHIVRNSDGTGGISVSDALDCLDVLNEDFEDHNISFFTDCDPDEIRNDDYTTGYSDSDLSDIFQEVVKHDGINIFLFPSDLNPGILGYGTLPGEGDYPAASIVGSFKGSYSGLTHIISHEIGHVLGLYHTNDDLDPDIQGDCFENYPGEGTCGCSGPCAYDGDLICDTYPDPYPFGNYGSNCVYLPELVINGVAYPIQTWCYEEFPIPDYTTPVTNIMALWQLITSGNCWAGGEFTFCQGLKMRKVVEEYGTTHGFLDDPNPAFQTYTITGPGTTNWTQKNVNGIIFVEAEAVLTITDRMVCFTPESGIIVKRGGKLIVDNSTLTAQCADKWKGIEVQGNGAAAQVNENGTLDETTNGVVVVRNGSMIKEALTGVQCGSLIEITAPSPFPPKGFGKFNPDLAGGLLVASNSSFVNNDVGAQFAPYPIIFENLSSFTNCSFSTNQEEDDARGIRIDGTGEIEITQCQFTENLSIGVDAINSLTKVNGGCSFSSFYGIIAYTTSLSYGSLKVLGTSSVKNTFDCEMPIDITSASLKFGAQIINNTFNDHIRPIRIIGPTIVNIGKNDFTDESDQSSPILLDNASGVNGIIYCNMIQRNLYSSIETSGNNDQLLLFANDMTLDEYQSGEEIPNMLFNGPIFPEQKYKNPVTAEEHPVSNTFDNPYTYWITSTDPFNYYVPLGGSANLIPLENGFSNQYISSDLLNCSNIPVNPSSPDQTERTYWRNLQDSLGTILQGSSVPDSVVYSDWLWAGRFYRDQVQSQEIAYYNSADSAGLITLWNESPDQNMASARTFSLVLQHGLLGQAQSMLSQLTVPWTDSLDYRQIQQLNLSRLWPDSSEWVSSSDSLWLDQIARSSSMNAGFARGLLHALYDIIIDEPAAQNRFSDAQMPEKQEAHPSITTCHGLMRGQILDVSSCLEDRTGYDQLRLEVYTSSGLLIASGNAPQITIPNGVHGILFFNLKEGNLIRWGKVYVP